MLIRNWVGPSCATVSVWPVGGDNSRISTNTAAAFLNTSGIDVQQLSKQKLHWKFKKKLTQVIKLSSGYEFCLLRDHFCFDWFEL